jgi:hypothetical protein
MKTGPVPVSAGNFLMRIPALGARARLRICHRAAIYERLYRSHYPARRDALTLATIWFFSLAASLPFAASDTARHLRDWLPADRVWIRVIGFMLMAGAAIWMLNSMAYRLKEHVIGKGDDLHLRYRALCFEERRKFLEATRAVENPTPPGFKGWLDIVAGPSRRRKNVRPGDDKDPN